MPGFKSSDTRAPPGPARSRASASCKGLASPPAPARLLRASARPRPPANAGRLGVPGKPMGLRTARDSPPPPSARPWASGRPQHRRPRVLKSVGLHATPAPPPGSLARSAFSEPLSGGAAPSLPSSTWNPLSAPRWVSRLGFLKSGGNDSVRQMALYVRPTSPELCFLPLTPHFPAASLGRDPSTFLPSLVLVFISLLLATLGAFLIVVAFLCVGEHERASVYIR